MRIENIVTINRPVEVVFAFVTAIENLPRYASTIVQAEQTSPGPLGVGTTLRMVGRFLGKQLDSTYRVTAYEPNRTLAYTSITGPESAAGGGSVDAGAAAIVITTTSILAAAHNDGAQARPSCRASWRAHTGCYVAARTKGSPFEGNGH